MFAKFRLAARRREREIGRGGIVISTEMSAATEGRAGAAGLEAVAVAPRLRRQPAPTLRRRGAAAIQVVRLLAS